MPGTAYGVGVGPGDPELITLKGARILGRCPVVAYPAPPEGESLARRIAAPHLGEGKTEVPIRMALDRSRFPDDHVYADAAKTLCVHLTAGRDVAVLCEGDPFFYGSFMYLFAHLAERHTVVVIPGVSSLMACAAALRAPLAARDDVLAVLPATLPAEDLARRLAGCEAAAIIKLGRHFPKVMAVLRDAKLEGCARYVERATMADERVRRLDEIDPAAVPYFATILVHRRGFAWS